MSMTHQLARLAHRPGQPHAIDQAVEARFQKLQQGLAGLAPRLGGPCEVPPELPLQESVNVASLLLLQETHAVFAAPALALVRAVLARRVTPPQRRAFGGTT